MPFRDLREALDALRRRGSLVEVGEEMSPRYEIAAFLDLAARRREAAYLFSNVRGSHTPVVANVVHNREVLALAMGVSPEEAVRRYAEGLRSPLGPGPAEEAPVEEIRMEAAGGSPGSGKAGGEIDLTPLLPVLTHYEGDSGPFVTTGLASMRNPETGLVERGICRMELLGRDSLGLGLANPPLSELWRRLREAGEPMPVAVSLGLEPLTLLAGALPPFAGLDKLALAGGVRGEAIEVFAAPLTGLSVPARSELLLEGHLESEARYNGPFGEVSGYYLGFGDTPRMRVRRVSHRSSPIYQALLPTGPEGDVLAALIVEASLAPHLRSLFPFVRKLAFLPRTFGSSLVVQVAEAPKPRVSSLLHHVLSMDRVKKVVVVAEDVDPADLAAVEWSVVTRCQPDHDSVVFSDLRAHPIDPSCYEGERGSRLGLDATGFERLRGQKGVSFPKEACSRAEGLWAALEERAARERDAPAPFPAAEDHGHAGQGERPQP
jgi:2,5-furandicarboxylate decarboxylase 1